MRNVRAHLLGDRDCDSGNDLLVVLGGYRRSGCCSRCCGGRGYCRSRLLFSDLLHDEAEDLDENNLADQDHEHGNKAHQNNLNGADVGLHNLTSFHRSVMEIKIENVICILKKTPHSRILSEWLYLNTEFKISQCLIQLF